MLALKNDIATHHYHSNSADSPTGELCHAYINLGFCWDQCCLGHPDKFSGPRAICVRRIFWHLFKQIRHLQMCVKHSVTYEDNICEHNYNEHGGNSICLLRGWTQLRKAGTRPESWWRVNVRVPSTWVMYLAESSALLSVPSLIPDASCPLPFTLALLLV